MPIDTQPVTRPNSPGHGIHRWVVVISGFLQDEGKPIGMVALWADLHRMATGGAATRVELRSWNDDWNALAELIWRQRPERGKVDIVICTYSWGGPSGMKLARHLGRRGIHVAHMVAADPVYRWLLALWRVFFRRVEIRVPNTVDRVTWFRQRRDWPAGHDLAADDPGRTIIEQAHVLDRGHAYMDDAPEFHRACKVAVTEQYHRVFGELVRKESQKRRRAKP